SDVIMHFAEIDLEAERLATPERCGNVRRLHETEPHLNAVDAVAKACDRMAFCQRHARPPVAGKSHQDQGFVHDAVVPDMVQQHGGWIVGAFGQPHAHAWDPRHYHLVDVLDELLERHRHLPEAVAHERGALAPAEHQSHHRATDGDRKPAAVDDL